MESERKTRLKRVDPLLKAAGWSLTDFKASTDVSKLKAHAVREFETANGPADYALVVDGTIMFNPTVQKVIENHLGKAFIKMQTAQPATGKGRSD